MRGWRGRWWSGLLAGVALVAAVTGVIALLAPYVPVLSLLVLYLLAVLPVAVAWGAGLAALTSLESVVIFAYFLPPVGSVSVADPPNAVALGVFLVTAVVVARLAARSQHAAVEAARLTDEQSALRRVATLVATGEPPAAVFAAVAGEVGRRVPADLTLIGRYGADATVTRVAGWSRTGEPVGVAGEVGPGTGTVTALVRETGRPARLDNCVDATGPAAEDARARGIGSSVGAPITVEGRVWGVMLVASTREDALPADTERRLAEFTELAAAAIANAQARVEVRTLAHEQAALRRVATLVAQGEPPAAVFSAVAEEVGRLLPVSDYTVVGRYDPDNAYEVVGGFAAAGDPVPVSSRISMDGRSVARLVLETGRPARVDVDGGGSGPSTEHAQARGIASAVGAPISVDGRAWGVMTVASAGEEPLPPDTEARLAGFTDLLATAIANAQAREELRRVAEEQAALRRVATLVAHAAPPVAVFMAVAEEIGRLLPSDAALVNRYDPDGGATVVGTWSRSGRSITLADHRDVGGGNVTARVFTTGRPARIDGYAADDSSAATAAARRAGLCSAVGTPITVDGRLWGAMIAASQSSEVLPQDTEMRLAGFNDLVASAIANAQAHAELTASRARVVAAADETRRRIERDLHDGAQQRLVSLALQLRAIEAAVPAAFDELSAELDSAVVDLTDVVDELREYARGIHPAVLGEGGLAPALRALARRSPVPVQLDVGAPAALPERVQVATYYLASEALTNAARHADATLVHVTVEADDAVLRVVVADDGVGGADPARGSGLVGMRDRVEATGGTLSVHSPPGEGTRLAITLPIGPGVPLRPG